MKKIKIPEGKRRRFPYFFITYPIIISRNKTYSRKRYFKFTESCLYKFEDGYRGVNKLFGFSYGFHHNNSFRFGWRPNHDLSRIEIVGYEYKDGSMMPYITIGEVNINEWYYYSITYNSNSKNLRYSLFGIDEKLMTRVSKRVKFKWLYWGYVLNFYFGGIYPAPQDLTFYMKKRF